MKYQHVVFIGLGSLVGDRNLSPHLYMLLSAVDAAD